MTGDIACGAPDFLEHEADTAADMDDKTLRSIFSGICGK